MRWRIGGTWAKTLSRAPSFLVDSQSSSLRLLCRSFRSSLPHSARSNRQDAATSGVENLTGQDSFKEDTSDGTENPLASTEFHNPDRLQGPEEPDTSSTVEVAVFDPRWLARPYSYPDTRFEGLPKSDARKLAADMALVDPEAVWFPIKATRPLLLTLDAFDTLFTPRTPVPMQYCQAAAGWGFELSENEVEASFRKAFKRLSKEYPNYGKEKSMHFRTWWSRIIENTLLPLLPESYPPATVPPDLIDMLYTQFSSSQGYALFPDVLPFLALVGTSFQAGEWAPKRTMLGVLSNSDPRVRDILSSFSIDISPRLFPPRHSPRSRNFDHNFGPADFAFATLSYECGHAKPSRMMFDAATRDAQHALDRLHPVARLSRSGLNLFNNVREDFHHMHVGDDVEDDVIPALNSGWDAVLLDRREEQEISTREVQGYQITVINNLMALQSVINRERLHLADGTPTQKPVWVDASRPIVPAPFPHDNWRRLKGRKVVEHPMAPDLGDIGTMD